jgi:hypothetical protein
MKRIAKASLVLVLLASACIVQAQEAPPVTAAEATPKPAATTPQADAAKPAARNSARADRLDLDTTVVSGNRELPKVLYIVPWKKAELGELPAQPFNTLLDEVLEPVDRDVFKREVKYFQAVSGGINAPKKEAAPATPATPPVTRY